uniref:Uncharacterized protein n=1 Tax=Bracon brevicornis TaxID=1563983 RepID=A0A6V7KUR2_9HYME
MSVRKPRKSRIPIVRRPQDKWRLTEEQEDRFRELEHLYMIKWNAIRPLTSINHRLDYFLDPEDEMYDFAVSTHETAYRKLLVELDLYLLDMVKLYAPFPLYRDLMEQHSDLVLDTSERCPGPRMNYKELYGSENVKRCTINEMRDRWRKKTINIDVLMENAPLFHAVVSSWEYTYQR